MEPDTTSAQARPRPGVPACVINAALYGAAGKLRDITLDEISDVLASNDGSFVWVGVYEPEDAILDKLQEEFDLHDLAIEDARNAHQRPKLEAYGDSLFVVVNTAQVLEERIRYGETHAFLGPRYLVTVRHGASLSYAPVRARVERDPELLGLGPSYALYAVLDAIVDNYLPIVDEFKQTLLAAPTLVASWYGMNFRHMPELGGRYSYYVLIGALALGCLGLYRYLKKVRWL
jgi:magnesium transporter